MDNIDRFECVYYPGPIPSNNAVLSVLCLVFDKIHFPNVYLPKGDYDKELLRQEISRLEALANKNFDTNKLINILKHVEYRLPLDGILEYPSSRGAIFRHDEDREERSRLAKSIYDLHFPPRENFVPDFIPASTKEFPDSDECVAYAGDFYYQAGAVIYAAQNCLPLLDDGSGLTMPFRAPYKDNAQALAALLAIENVELELPNLPLFNVQELVDFRIENKKELQDFRASMLRYAKMVNAEFSKESSNEEILRKIKFFIETVIQPTLHSLNRDLQNPNRPWHKRMIDFGSVSFSVILGLLTGGVAGQTAAEGLKGILRSELSDKGDKNEAARGNGLYYLLKARTIGR